MLKKLCAALLSLSMICSIAVVPAAAEERSTVSQAVYLGVENYGTLDRDSMDTFTHCFWNDGVTVKYQVSTANNYKVQNVLQEGYLYDLTVAGGMVTAATLLNGDAAGTVTAISANSIQVENQTVTTDSHSAIYSISASAGLVTVKEDTLKVGDTVRVFANNGVAARIYKTFVAQPYTPPVDGTAGTKTLKNFLATALEPVGTGLYIYGGTWDWQDVGSSNQAATIGIPQSWIDFFQSQDASFTYRDKDGKDANKDAAHSYYPYGEWNQYYYAGVDCSGYVAWVLYNTMNTVSGGAGYVEGAKKMAQSCTTRGWGTLTTSFGTPTNHADSDFHPGDIFSMNGHVWICLGTCDDGSIVFMHSTPSDSKAGQPGGGVQISALNPKNTGKNCEAYRLASYYMAKFFPAWSARYDAVLKGYEDYTSFSKPECGKFSWSLAGANGSLTDPEGYASKTPAQILSELFQDSGPDESNYTARAVYLGVQDYGTVSSTDKANFQHRFYVNGAVKSHPILTGASEGYAIQNSLQEGYLYDLTVANGMVTAATQRNGDLYGVVTATGSGYIRLDGEKFFVTGRTTSYKISTAAGGASVTTSPSVQTGDTVRIFVDEDDNITELYKTFVAADYTAPVSGIPGKTTLKNFIATALEPVGTGLYIYGGTWDWQDVGSSKQATTIGLSQSWIDFFQSQDANYTYKNSANPAHSYYPHKSWNQYYYAGIDCSAYVAWATYNVLNTQSGGSGYVMSSTKMAKNFAQTQNWGTWTQSFSAPTSHAGSDFHVGDIFSMNGHVWICLGTCDDGSIVFMHSTPSDSKTGNPGGGVQISALNPKDTGKNCEAYRLASSYMTKYYPAWSARYDAVLKDYSGYTSFTGTSAGKFSWSLDGSGALTDPEGYASKTPAQILADLFPLSSNSGSGSSSSGNTAGNTIALPSGPDAVTGGSVSLSKTNAKAGETVTATPKATKGYEAIDLIVKDSSGKTIAVTKNADGTYSFKMPAGTVSVTPSFGKIQYYGDVPQTAYYADAVWQLRVSGIMNGKSEGVFSGGEKLNRQQLWMLLARADGKTPANMAEAKIWATGAGVSDGSAATGDISRQQLAVMLWRQAGSPQVTSEKLDNFTDAKAVADYAKMAICWVAENNILTGNNGAVSPEAPASRANAAVMLVRYLNSIA